MKTVMAMLPLLQGSTENWIVVLMTQILWYLLCLPVYLFIPSDSGMVRVADPQERSTDGCGKIRNGTRNCAIHQRARWGSMADHSHTIFNNSSWNRQTKETQLCASNCAYLVCISWHRWNLACIQSCKHRWKCWLGQADRSVHSHHYLFHMSCCLKAKDDATDQSTASGHCAFWGHIYCRSLHL